MHQFQLDDFVRAARVAASDRHAGARVRAVMEAAFVHPRAIAAAMSDFSGEGEVLFEDETVSIWYCGFDPHTHIPPHDHQSTATIGVYAGMENNHFYRAKGEGLEYKSTRRLEPGDVISCGPQTIHSVETANDAASFGIHVYLAPLSKIERSLFDWETGVAKPFTEVAYEQMKRPSTA
jgi:predicted metal-dependent enzyme (double-stranded beta helix superfamily)